MIALLASAWAAGPYLAGGLAVTPNPGTLIVPAWRLGVATDRVVGWGSATFAALDVDQVTDGNAIAGMVVRPRLGARFMLGDTQPQAPGWFLATNVSTLVFALYDDGEDVLVRDAVSVRIPFGVGLGFGLKAKVNEVIAVSPEIGLDWENSRTISDGNEVLSFGTLLTVAALNFDILP